MGGVIGVASEQNRGLDVLVRDPHGAGRGSRGLAPQPAVRPAVARCPPRRPCLRRRVPSATAVGRAANSGGRGQRGEPRGRGRHARESRLSIGNGRERNARARGGGRDELRGGADGLPDAGDGRLDRHPGDPAPRGGSGAQECRSSRSPPTRWKPTASAASPPAWTIFSPSPSRRRSCAAVLGRWAPVAHAPRHDQALLAAGETAQARTSAATAAAMDIAVIDTGVLRDIAALGRPALLGSLIDLYLEHSRPLLETIESAIRGREPAGLRRGAPHAQVEHRQSRRRAPHRAAPRVRVTRRRKRGAAAVSQLARLPAAYHEFCEALIRERSASAA